MQRAPLVLAVPVLALLVLTGCGAPDPVVDGKTASTWQALLTDRSKPAEERRHAADALRRLPGGGSAEVARALSEVRAKDGDEELRRRATAALESCGEAGVDGLVAALGDPSPRIVEVALAALGRMGAGRAAPAVAALLPSREPTAAAGAAEALAHLGPPAADAVLPLAGHGSESVRERVLDVLRVVEPASPRTKAALAKAMNDSAWTVRRKAYAGLGAFAAGDATVRESLVRGLDDANPYVVREALLAIAQAKSVGETLGNRVAALLDSEVGPVRAAAARAVGELRLGAALPAVEAALAREKGVARVELLVARWVLTGRVGPFLDDVRAVLKGGGELRAEAVLALAPLKEVAAPAVPELVALLADPSVRLHAVDALGAVGPRAASAESALRALLQDPNATVRERAGKALVSVRRELGEGR